MTWNEFKKLVDDRLEESAFTGDVEVWYIDVSYPDEHVNVEVETRDTDEGDVHHELTIS